MNDLLNIQHSEGDSKRMVQKSVIVDAGLWDAARQKVGVYGSLSQVIRKLLRLWVTGKINLDDYPEMED